MYASRCSRVGVLRSARDEIRNEHNSENETFVIGNSSAGLADLVHPAAQHFDVRRFQINKLNSHANPRFHDSDHAQRFHLLVLAYECNSQPGIGGSGRPGATNPPPMEVSAGSPSRLAPTST